MLGPSASVYYIYTGLFLDQLMSYISLLLHNVRSPESKSTAQQENLYNALKLDSLRF